MIPADFYRDLPALDSLAEALEGDRQADLPDDWWLVVADVAGSTRAIEAGAYKKVNTVGAACIAAVINVDRSVAIPFLFGGDGATFAVPESLRERVIPALREAQRMSRRSFDLELRVGMIRASTLRARKLAVRLAKVRLSPNVTQPAFAGRGWEEAERMVKDAAAEDVLRVCEQDGPCEGSFEGFECRWRSVPSFNGHKLALIVAAVADDPAVNLATYRALSERIAAIYGDISHCHPLRAERMQLAFGPRELGHEWRVRSDRGTRPQRIAYFMRLLFLNAAGTWLFARKRDTQSVRWSRYVADMVDNSDVRKFDGALRMVIDGSEAQRDELRRHLDEQHRKGLLAWGMHISREALVTCIVSSYNGNHIHFVDGSDGGYAMAARDLKARLRGTPVQ